MAPSRRRPLVAGNWKMNGLRRSTAELTKIVAGAKAQTAAVELMVCPPTTLLIAFADIVRGSAIGLGGQDCHAEPFGPFTGDISAEMLKDAGATAVILGHSERRTLHKETDAEVRAKVLAAWRAGLGAIVCIGETRAERDAGRTLDVLAVQMQGSLPPGATVANLVVAYEPVWAIGTGLTPTAADIAKAHQFIRGRLSADHGGGANAVRILYGGSVKPSNARELMSIDNVDGALVGGASLTAEEFLGIAGSYLEMGR